MTTSTTRPPAPVPPLTVTAEARVYGGAYWDHHDAQVQFTTGTDRSVTLTFDLEDGTPFDPVVLTADQVREAAGVISAELGVTTIPGLAVEPTWKLETEEVVVDLTGALSDIADWLPYVTGERSWDYEENGPEYY
jgi:hypothetical protein